MKKENLCKSGKFVISDPVYCYIYSVAIIIFLYISFRNYAEMMYEHLMIIPCSLFLCAILERKGYLGCKKYLLLACLMVAWFLLLQLKRSIQKDTLSNVGVFLSTYLFAFPLASLLKDGDEKKALRVFAGAYLAAAAVLAVTGLLLILDCLPAFLSKYVYWTGARLEVFWHPNVAACLFLIGIVFCVTFLSQAKSLWSKLILCILLTLIIGALALTNCRTALILTGGYIGALAFFALIKHGKKWFLPGLLAVIILTVGFYAGAGRLYQLNQDRLIAKYARQYSEQLAPEYANSSVNADLENADIISAEGNTAGPESDGTMTTDVNTEGNIHKEESAENYAKADAADTETAEIPVTVNPETGEIVLETDSPQGSLATDFGTLNNRTHIWRASLYALSESRSVLLWGTENPGDFVSEYFTASVVHTHNAWMECLVGMGFVGFLIAMIFTLITLWNILIILIKHHQDLWKRNIALLTMCIMVASLLEPYIFYTTIYYHPIDFLFFLCAGYLVHWQESDNLSFADKLRARFLVKK